MEKKRTNKGSHTATAVYRKDSPPSKAPRFFRIVVYTFIVYVDSPSLEMGGGLRIDEETILYVNQLVWKEAKTGRKKVNDTEMEDIRHSGPMLPRWAHTLPHTLQLSFPYIHILYNLLSTSGPIV